MATIIFLKRVSNRPRFTVSMEAVNLRFGSARTLRCSVDTSVQWVTRVNTQLGRDTVKHIDVGDVGDWGRPKTYDFRRNFIRYAESLWLDES